MKRKILMITAILAVMVAMTGIAAAINSLSVVGDGISIDTNLGGDHLVTIDTGGYTVDYFNITGPLDKFTIKVDGSVKTPQLIDGILTIEVPATTLTTYTFTFVNNKGAPNGEYVFDYNLMWTRGSSTRTGHIEAGVSAIPEFPAVALPVALVIGLVFFFQQRKNKEE